MRRHDSSGQRADAARRGYDRAPMNDNQAQYQQHKQYNVSIFVRYKLYCNTVGNSTKGNVHKLSIRSCTISNTPLSLWIIVTKGLIRALKFFNYCSFIKSGHCIVDPCPYPHLSEIWK